MKRRRRRVPERMVADELDEATGVLSSLATGIYRRAILTQRKMFREDARAIMRVVRTLGRAGSQVRRLASHAELLRDARLRVKPVTKRRKP